MGWEQAGRLAALSVAAAVVAQLVADAAKLKPVAALALGAGAQLAAFRYLGGRV